MEAISKELILGIFVGAVLIYLIYIFITDKKNIEDNQLTIEHHLNSYRAIEKAKAQILEAVNKKHIAEDRIYNRYEIEKEQEQLKNITNKLNEILERVKSLEIEEQRLNHIIKSKEQQLKAQDIKIKDKVREFTQLEEVSQEPSYLIENEIKQVKLKKEKEKIKKSKPKFMS